MTGASEAPSSLASASRSGRKAKALFILSVTLLSSALWLLRWESAKSQYMGDSYSYAERTYEMAGYSEDDARHMAVGDVCLWLSHRSDRAHFHGCDRTYTPQREPYKAIFHDRVGFPALVVVLMPAFHRAAFPVALALCAVLCGLAVALIARLAGASRPTALLAAGLLFCVRDSTWLARVGSEGPALLGILGILAGLIAVRRGLAPRRFAALTVVSGVWLLAVRPSTAVALGLAIFMVYGVSAISRRRFRVDGPIAILGGLSAAAVTEELRLRHSPGLAETLKDTFTHHFAKPQLHPLSYEYFALLSRTGHSLVHGVTHHPVAPVLALVGAGLAIAVRRLRAPAVCVVLVAWASVLAHPIFTEIPRLLSPGTSIEALGLAFGVARLVHLVKTNKSPVAASRRLPAGAYSAINESSSYAT